MFVIKVSYKKPIDVVDSFLAAHRAFLDRYFAAGNMIATGPQNPRRGGVIMCKAASLEAVGRIISEDPFKINDIADYEIIEFEPTKFCDGSLRGLLC